MVGKPFGGVVLGFGFGCGLRFVAVFLGGGEEFICLVQADKWATKSQNCVFIAALHVCSITTFSVEIAVFGSIPLQQLTNYYELEIMGALWKQRKYSLSRVVAS